jgi:hypothetical protein
MNLFKYKIYLLELIGLLFTILAGLFWQKGDFIVDIVAPLLEHQIEFLQEKIYI